MKFEKVCVTIPEPILKAGKKLAKGKLRNFSSYVSDLIKRDQDEMTRAERDEKAERQAA